MGLAQRSGRGADRFRAVGWSGLATLALGWQLWNPYQNTCLLSPLTWEQQRSFCICSICYSGPLHLLPCFWCHCCWSNGPAVKMCLLHQTESASKILLSSSQAQCRQTSFLYQYWEWTSPNYHPWLHACARHLTNCSGFQNQHLAYQAKLNSPHPSYLRMGP